MMKKGKRRSSRRRQAWLFLLLAAAVRLCEGLLFQLNLTDAEKLLLHVLALCMAFALPCLLLPLRSDTLHRKNLGGSGMLWLGLAGMAMTLPLGMVSRVFTTLFLRLGLSIQGTTLQIQQALFVPGLLVTALTAPMLGAFLWGVSGTLPKEAARLWRMLGFLFCLAFDAGPLQALFLFVCAERMYGHFDSVLAPVCMMTTFFLSRYFVLAFPVLPGLLHGAAAIFGTAFLFLSLGKALACPVRREEIPLSIELSKKDRRLALLAGAALLLSILSAEVLL